MDKTAIISASVGWPYDGHASALKDALSARGLGSQSYFDDAYGKRELEQYVKRFDAKNAPITATTTYKTDDFPVKVARMSSRPVISSRIDWESPSAAEAYFFTKKIASTVTHSVIVTPSGIVMGPEQTAEFIKNVSNLGIPNEAMEGNKKPVCCAYVPDSGIGSHCCSMHRQYDREPIEIFFKHMQNIGVDMEIARSLDEVDKNELCVFFGDVNRKTEIDKLLEDDAALVLCPPGFGGSLSPYASAKRSQEQGYYPPVAMVRGPTDAAIFAGALIGIFSEDVKEAASAYRDELDEQAFQQAVRIRRMKTPNPADNRVWASLAYASRLSAP